MENGKELLAESKRMREKEEAGWEEKVQKAIECYDKALEIKPNDASLWYSKAQALLHFDKREEAIKCYDKVLEIGPKYHKVWCLKGDIFVDLKKYREAIECYDEASKIRGGDVSLWKSKAEFFTDLGEYAEAVECYDKALELDSRNEAAWFSKGLVLHKLKKREEAIDCYDKVIELCRASTRTGLNTIFREAWINKGVALYELGRYYKTIECCDEAFRFFPNDADICTIRGRTLGRPAIGRYQEAIECYDASLGISERGDLWCYRGEALLELGKRSEAIASFKKALEFYDDEKLGPEDMLLKGKALLNLRRYGEAIPCFKKMIKIYGKSTDSFERRQREECVEGAVHAYIFEHDGKINIAKCAKDLNISEGEVKAAIGVLEAGGKLERG